MKCPVCDESMIVVEYHNIELDYCQKCHGSWFDHGELDLLLHSMELEGSIALLDRIVHQPQAATQEENHKCPVCRHRMQKHTIGNAPEITVDVCPREHGIWFDAGEIHRLVSGLAGHAPSEYGSEQELVTFLGEVFEAEEDLSK